jgi:hypothetical protein
VQKNNKEEKEMDDNFVQSLFDKSAEAQEIKSGALRVL